MTWLYLVAAALSGIGLLFTVIDWGRGAKGALGSLLFFSLGLMIAVGGLGWIHCSQSAGGCFSRETPVALVTSTPRAPVRGDSDGGERVAGSSTSPGGSSGTTGDASSWWSLRAKPFLIDLLPDVLSLIASLLGVVGFVLQFRHRASRR